MGFGVTLLLVALGLLQVWAKSEWVPEDTSPEATAHHEARPKLKETTVVDFQLDNGGELECFCRYSLQNFKKSAYPDTFDLEIDHSHPFGAIKPHHCFETCRVHDCKYIYRDSYWEEWFTCVQGCKEQCYGKDGEQEKPKSMSNDAEVYEDAMAPDDAVRSHEEPAWKNGGPEVIVLDESETEKSMEPTHPVEGATATVPSVEKPSSVEEKPGPVEEKPASVKQKNDKVDESKKDVNTTNVPPAISLEDFKKLVKEIKTLQKSPPPAPKTDAKDKNVTINLDIIPVAEGSDLSDIKSLSSNHHVIEVHPEP